MTPPIELPALTITAITAVNAASRPTLVNRDPSPDESDVPLGSAVAFELVDPGLDGIDLRATRVWIDGVLAFDGAASPAIQPPYNGPRALVTTANDTLRLVLDPRAAFASEAVVTVRVMSATLGGAHSLDESYAFAVEDRTAPRLVAGIATDPRTFRLVFDEPVLVTDVNAITLAPATAPAVPLVVVDVAVSAALVEVIVSPEMTPDARYIVRALGVTDLHGNPAHPPFDRIDVAGFRPARPPGRRFDLGSMLPKHNRRSDVTGDLARFIACLQEVTDLLLAEVDRFPDIFDLERAPDAFLDLLLRDLGNPFPFELDTLGKRRLAAVLVEMYRQTGTAIGIRNAVRFFLGVDIDAIAGLAATALVLGESELGVDWELGPSDRFARYAFSVSVGRVLTSTERQQLRALVERTKPAHTHFVDLLEPLPVVVPDHWEIGMSDVGDTTLLH